MADARGCSIDPQDPPLYARRDFMNEPVEAFNAGIPAYGTWVLYAFIVTAAFAFALSVAAATADRSAAGRYLRAARLAALGTCALIALDVLLLLYAFVSHDFRIRYVMRYSDRSMPAHYLVTALWGGQDGSLLWWTFLLSLYTGACVLWLKDKYRHLAPYVIATLMVVVMFFGVLMAFAANPFSVNVAGAPPDGEGLNPSLQNFYMAIHPPSLYVGFVGCAVPFALAIAALLSGRLDEEWIRASRRWALFAWLFLSIGNTLGMLWAYEELGWGGYWAWDPVENASAMPWFTMTAYLHSVMIQERRGSLKVWNLALIILTFLLTIFGTFLTRSGLIASIHSFAQSEIGVYFIYFLALCLAVSVALVAWRYPLLRKPTEIDAVLSREAMFVANNWLLLGICTFILVATTWPKLSEWLWRERVTVGANFYNAWLSVPGLVLLALMGIGTLTPWRKGSGALLWKAFRVPLAAGVLVALLAAISGRYVGYPMYVPGEPIYLSLVGIALAKVNGAIAPVALGLIAFNIAAVVQEFWRGVAARMRARNEGALTALARLVSRHRRRYGGYIVHVGIVTMFFGFTGGIWKTEAEAALQPGEHFKVGRYELRYDGVETRRDPNKREIYARVTVNRDGRYYETIRPAKFVYTTHPDMPTSEVSITSSWREDLYVILASVQADNHVAHLKAFVNPFVVWIWIGCMVLILGATIAIWPEVSLEWAQGIVPADPDANSSRRTPSTGEATATLARQGPRRMVLVALTASMLFRIGPAHAQGHTTSAPPPVGGTIERMSPVEKRLFDRLLCMCGDCQRLPLATCTCDFAATTRARMRERLRAGVPEETIVQDYVNRYGPAALAVPPDAGHNRGVYILPIAAMLAGAVVGAKLIQRWRARAVETPSAYAAMNNGTHTARVDDDTWKTEYDRRIDEELRGLDD